MLITQGIWTPPPLSTALFSGCFPSVSPKCRPTTLSLLWDMEYLHLSGCCTSTPGITRQPHHQELPTCVESFHELTGIPEIHLPLLKGNNLRGSSLQQHNLPYILCQPYSDFVLYTRLAPKPQLSLQLSLPSPNTLPAQTFPSNSHICPNTTRAPRLHLFCSSLPPGTVSICTPLSSTLLLPLPLPLCWRSFMSEPIAMVTGNLLYVSSPGAVNEGVLTAFE